MTTEPPDIEIEPTPIPGEPVPTPVPEPDPGAVPVTDPEFVPAPETEPAPAPETDPGPINPIAYPDLGVPHYEVVVLNDWLPALLTYVLEDHEREALLNLQTRITDYLTTYP